MIYSNTALVRKSNFVATIASYMHVFKKHSIKKNTHTTHALKLFLTGKRKLHEVTRQPRSLCSFPFWKAWIGGQESAFKKDKKRALGTEGNTTFFFYAISLIVTRVLLLPQLDVASGNSMRKEVSKVSTCGPFFTYR